MTLEKKPIDKKRLWGVAVTVAAAAFGSWASQQFFKKPSFEKELMQTASDMNKSCPIMVDKDTRLDNAIPLPGNVFRYNYTLVNFAKEDLNTDELKKVLEPTIVNNVKTNPDLKPFRDHKVTMDYYYKDKNGVALFDIDVTPAEYQGN